jgi:arginine exporter protein ArgO
MRTEHPTTHRTRTVSNWRHGRSRAVLAALAVVVLTPLAFVGGLVVIGALAAANSFASALTAVGLLAAPVVVGSLLARGLSSHRDGDARRSPYGPRFRR